MSDMLYVVVPTLNNYEHTARLIQGLLKVPNSVVKMRLVLIDNGTDGTAAKISNAFGPRAIIVEGERNLGVAASWNLGIRIALSQEPKAILVAGQDTVPHDGTIQRLLKRVEAGALFCSGTAQEYGSVSLVQHAPQEGDSVLEEPDFSFWMASPALFELVGNFDASVAHQIQMAKDAKNPCLTSPWTWGLFDERLYPAYFEDNDYHYRCHMAGIPLLRDPRAYFQHDTSLTVRTNQEIASKHQSRFEANRRLFVAKWGAEPKDLPIRTAKPLNVDDETWTRLCGGSRIVRVEGFTKSALDQASIVAPGGAVGPEYIRSEAEARKAFDPAPQVQSTRQQVFSIDS